MLGFGVEIWVSKLKLRTVVGESLVIALVKVPKNPRTGFSFFSSNSRWPPRNLVLLTFQHETEVISRASSRSPC